MNDAAGTEPSSIRNCVELIGGGGLTSEQLVQDCLSTIQSTDADIGAWAHLDQQQALAQARERDEWRRRGKPLGDLHGIPVGIKDVFDTADQPTQRGTAIYVGRQPDADCAVVEKLREAGAVILGKTANTELAFVHPGATRNPHNAAYSPGGSSSGSAAAVAAAHVPLAVGSQTNGSTIRPASYCGIYGFKPTTGIISRRGVLQTSATLDQVGVFGRDVGDVALLADVLAGYDAADGMSYLAPRPRMLRGYLSEVPIEPIFACIDLPYAERFSDAVRAGMEELLDALGGQVERVQAPRFFADLIDCHQTIYDYEIYRCLRREREEHGHLLSDAIQEIFARAAGVGETDYRTALETRTAAIQWFQEFFNDYDAIVTPSANGEAPPMGPGTGDPVCCTIWTLCGLPCISLPLLTGHDNLPVGVQLVGGYNEDDRLLRTTRWLLRYLNSVD